MTIVGPPNQVPAQAQVVRPVDLDPTPDESNLEQREVAGLSQGQIVRRRFLRHRGAMISVVVLVLVLVLATTSIGWGPIPAGGSGPTTMSWEVRVANARR